MNAFYQGRRKALRWTGASLMLSIGLVKQVSATCAGTAELGRWQSVGPQSEPAVLDLRMTSCGDQVLNGKRTETRFEMRAWVQQSSGNLFGRPPVAAHYREWQGHRWLTAKVPTGGYVDSVWARAAELDGQPALYAVIRHDSLDSKQSAISHHWFRFERSL